MVQTPHRYHMVHYRRILSKPGEKSLEYLCRAALSEPGENSEALFMRPLDRIWKFKTDDTERQIVMNRVADLNSAIFGEICLGQENDLQALLRLTTKQVKLSELTMATVFDLSETRAPTGAQFIRGTGYWLAIGDHLFSIQLGALNMRQTQGYLSWLIENAAKRLGMTRVTTDFRVEIDVAEVGEAGIGDVRNLRIKGNSALGVRVPVDTDSKQRKYSRTVRRAHQQSERAIPMAEAILGTSRTKSLIESLGPEEFLTALGEIRVAGTRTEASRDQIRLIAHEIADETDAEVTVEGKFGKIKNGDVILRTKMPFDAPNDGGTLLDFDNVADQLQEVYSRFVKDGKIKA